MCVCDFTDRNDCNCFVDQQVQDLNITTQNVSSTSVTIEVSCQTYLEKLGIAILSANEIVRSSKFGCNMSEVFRDLQSSTTYIIAVKYQNTTCRGFYSTFTTLGNFVVKLLSIKF